MINIILYNIISILVYKSLYRQLYHITISVLMFQKDAIIAFLILQHVNIQSGCRRNDRLRFRLGL